jgi:hypothetical protein
MLERGFLQAIYLDPAVGVRVSSPVGPDSLLALAAVRCIIDE